MARLRALAAALVLLAIVGAVPVGLWWWGVSPAGLAALLRPDDGSGILAALTLVGWVAWLAFTVSVVIEAVNVIGHRTVPLQLPMLGGLQALAGALVATALSSVVVPATVAPPAAAAPARVATAVEPGADARTNVAHDESAGYLVRPGDDLWSIAEQLLGEGGQWRLLAEANPDILVNPTVDLRPGVRLTVPEVPDSTHRAPAKPERKRPGATPLTVVVERGDTLSGLAEEHLGSASAWPRIHQANRDRIKDPDLIDIGWRLLIPARTTAGTPKPAHHRPVRKPVPAPEVHRPQIEQPAPTPATARPSGEASPSSQEPQTGQLPEMSAAPASDPAWPLLGGLSAAAAAMIIAGVSLARLDQLRARPLGHRITHPPVDVRRYETALGRRERPDVTALLETALRALGAHAHGVGRPLPRLSLVRLDGSGVTFVWSEVPALTLPEGFRRVTATSWRLTRATADKLPQSSHPVPFPALVTVGREAEGGWIMVDLEARSPLALDGPRLLRHAAAAAMAVELSCSPWASELTLTVVGGDEVFVRAACPELVRFHAEPAGALDALAAVVRQRADADAPTALLRTDPDRAEAGAAQIVLVADELDEADRVRFLELLDDRDLGVGGVIAGRGESALVLSGTEDDPHARLDPDRQELRPHLVPAHTRAAIGTIFVATDELPDDQAPWWSEADNVRTLTPRRESVRIGEPEPEVVHHPYLRLLGPIELLGAAGPTPARSRRQCEEYCAWLLENPQSMATRMAAELVVAETTRRSNMSRLRSWLGSDATGKPYLPEAYSGRIELHPAVESDWQRVQTLAAPGVNRLTPETLVALLEYVRGAPLADAAPGQWRWAEELRTDMSSLVRDAGVVLTRWALHHHDLDVARWAAARALLAAPEDELLLVERINTEALAGNPDEVQRLVRWVTGQARVLGVDLAPETIEACQRAMEGRTRPRAAR
ncbi:MAG: LysM peptidoglycan-binding domain-containing protein [Micropruina sp.]|uniref:LysM peptidoglycan-binding domain-containing protein n=1 Tax=Micropruina sp. TaxID=2737536 RepID=UPI0039E5A06A